MILELFEDNTILLILDNFETVQESEKDKIIRFFSIETKRRLRNKPNNLKIIITSRVLIPSGFHPFKLDGLDKDDSRKLISQLETNYKYSQKKLSSEQVLRLQEVSHNIPIIIIHCLGRIFEFNESVKKVIDDLASEPTNVVDFSFKEILNILDKNLQLSKILILLEAIKGKLMTRQMSDILNISAKEIESILPTLINFQCIEVFNEGSEQKYAMNNNHDLMIKQFVKRNHDIANEIRASIRANYIIEKTMDYSEEEEEIIGIFNSFIIDSKVLDAEMYLEEQKQKKPSSTFLQYHHCKFLVEHKNDYRTASVQLTKLVEDCKRRSKIDPNILALTIKVLTSAYINDYSAALSYVTELEYLNVEDDKMYLLLAEYYINYSTQLKLIPDPFDPVEYMKKTSLYKEKAFKGVEYINKYRAQKDHHYYQLLSSGQFNLNDNEPALNNIQFALKLVANDPNFYQRYLQLRRNILKAIDLVNKKKRKPVKMGF